MLHRPICSLIFVSLENWDDIWRRNQFVCAELARRYPDMQILFVCPPRDVSNALRTRRLGSLRGPNNWHPEGFPNITVTRPLKLLPSTLAVGRWVNDFMARVHVRGMLRLTDHGSRIKGDGKLGVRSWELEEGDAGEPTTKAQRHEGRGEDPQITRITQIDDAGKFTTEVGEVTEAENIECTANTAITACTEDSNSYLLTPNSSGNSSPQFFIAGEGDQRAECERLIAALRFNDHGARNVEQKLGVRSWKLEDDDEGGFTTEVTEGTEDDGVTGNRGQGTGGGAEVTGYRLQGTGLAGQPAGRGSAGAGPTESAALPQHSNSYLLTSNSSQANGGAVRLLGFRSDVSVLMAACDIFVLPAPAEPFGLVIIEAMALGKPVIAAGAGGPVEIVVDGETGLLFEPGNSQSLAVAMQRLLIDAPLRQRMGEASRQRYAKFFTADQMAKKMLAVYSATGGEVRS